MRIAAARALEVHDRVGVLLGGALELVGGKEIKVRQKAGDRVAHGRHDRKIVRAQQSAVVRQQARELTGGEAPAAVVLEDDVKRAAFFGGHLCIRVDVRSRVHA